MEKEMTNLMEAKEVVQNIIKRLGEPKSDQSINDFLSTEENLLDKFNMVLKLIDWYMENKERMRKDVRQPFSITIEDISKVNLPEYPIGINEFAKCVNKVIDIKKTKGISGVQINKRLKELGILSEKEENGKKCTITNKDSKNYGIESTQGEYNGRKYEKVIFTDKGKEFLLNHFLEIMQLDEVSAAK